MAAPSVPSDAVSIAFLKDKSIGHKKLKVMQYGHM